MTMTRLPAWLVVIVPVLAACAAGADPDPVRERLERARANYEASEARFRKNVVDALNRKAEAARRDGNKKLLDQARAEQEAFDARGQVPKVVPTVAEQRAVKQARQV
jgi:hypothetical protein